MLDALSLNRYLCFSFLLSARDRIKYDQIGVHIFFIFLIQL